MASYTLTITHRGQKLPGQATATGTEDEYTVSLGNTFADGTNYLQFTPSTNPIVWGSASGQTAADGYPIPVGQSFTIPIGNGTKVYIRGVTGAGRVDFVAL